LDTLLAVEIAVVAVLFVLNGFFAMAEISIVSSRRAHLERLAKEGRAGAQAALALADDKARMLAAVQVGVTTTAIFAGIFGGATLAERLEHALPDDPILAEYGKLLSIAVITLCVTYPALIIGELAPKHIALNDPESIAVRAARPLAFVARAAAPAIWLLNHSTRLLLLRVVGHLRREGRGRRLGRQVSDKPQGRKPRARFARWRRYGNSGVASGDWGRWCGRFWTT